VHLTGMVRWKDWDDNKRKLVRRAAAVVHWLKEEMVEWSLTMKKRTSSLSNWGGYIERVQHVAEHD